MITKYANAKINLALNIVGERDDGYHLVDMVMIPINVYDRLTFEESDDVKVENSIGIMMEDDIVFKAVKILKEKYNIDKGIKITIDKRIPHQAGLGGGSSDAAVVLKTLNELWDLKLTVGELEKIALRLGCDVVFFIKNKPARVSGIGEIIQEIDVNVDVSGVIMKPCFGFETKKMYASLKYYELKKNQIDNLVATLRDGGDYLRYIFNDFEETVYDKISIFKNDLFKKGAQKTIMSGSGSSIVAFCDIYDKVYNDYQYVSRFKMIDGE